MNCELGANPESLALEGKFMSSLEKGHHHTFETWSLQEIFCYLWRIKRHKLIFLISFFSSSISLKKCQNLVLVNIYSNNPKHSITALSRGCWLVDFSR